MIPFEETLHDDDCVKLWVGVFERAKEDYEMNNKFALNAELWFRSGNQHVGSFLWLCELFGWNPGSVKNKILKYNRVKYKHLTAEEMKEWQRRDMERQLQDAEGYGEKKFVGSMCKRNHEYKNTGGSLRWKNSHTCIQCQKEHFAKNHDKYAILNKKNQEKNKDRLKYLKYKRMEKNKKEVYQNEF